MGDIALRGNKLTKGRGPHGHGPKPFLNRPGQAQGTHGGKAKGGRIGKFGGGRTNLLEELGRVEAEPSNRNRRAEISRVHGELNRGYNKGGRVGLKHGGKPWGTGPKPGTLEHFQHTTQTPKRKRKAEGGRIGLRTGSRGPSAGERIKARKARADEWWTAKHGTSRSFHPGIDKQLREKRPHSSPEGRAHDVKKIMSKYRTDKIQADVAKFKRTAPSGRALHKKGGKADKNWIQKATASIKRRKTKGKCTPITKPGCTGRAKALAKTFKKMAAKRKS